MIPELGKYAVPVLSAYGVTGVVLLAIVGLSLLRARRVKAELERLEQEWKRDRGQ